MKRLFGTLGLLIASACAAQASSHTQIYERATHASVHIHTYTIHGFYEDKKAEDAGEGSGFLIDKDRGLIMTNAHVAGHGPTDLYVQFFKQDKLTKAERVFVDPYHDIAIIKVPVSAMPVTAEQLTLDCEYTPSRGEEILAIGHPEGTPFQVTRGVISGEYDDDVDGLYWSTDLVIEPGSSGGAAISLNTGKVIGVPTFNLKESDISLLTKASNACLIWQPFEKGLSPKRPILGFQPMLINNHLTRYVGWVDDPNSPLKSGDLIKSWDNGMTWDIDKVTRFADLLRGYDKPSVDLEIERDGQTLQVTLPLKAGIAQNEREWVYFTGMTFADATQEDNNHLARYHPENVIRLQTKKINESELIGVEINKFAILHSVNGTRVTSIQQLYPLLKEAQEKEGHASLVFNSYDFTPEAWRYMFKHDLKIKDLESNVSQAR